MPPAPYAYHLITTSYNKADIMMRSYYCCCFRASVYFFANVFHFSSPVDYTNTKASAKKPEVQSHTFTGIYYISFCIYRTRCPRFTIFFQFFSIKNHIAPLHTQRFLKDNFPLPFHKHTTKVKKQGYTN